MKTYTKEVANTYNNLNWVLDPEQLEILKILIDPNIDTTRVLDFGCDTGIVSQYLAKFVKTVIALDNSKEMLEKFRKTEENISIVHGTLCQKEPEFLSTSHFDVIVSRMVFHHLENKIKYMRRAFELLKSGGMLIIQENGISSNHVVNLWFHEMMRQKEPRYFLSEDQLVFDMYSAGFGAVQTYRHISRNFSVLNWLKNTENNENTQNYLIELFKAMPEEIKHVYNYREIDSDILLDIEILWVMGYKCIEK